MNEAKDMDSVWLLNNEVESTSSPSRNKLSYFTTSSQVTTSFTETIKVLLQFQNTQRRQ